MHEQDKHTIWKKAVEIAPNGWQIEYIIQDLENQKQQYDHRRQIWNFVKTYLIISGIAILGIIAVSMYLKAVGRDTLSAWSMSVLISGSFGQLVCVLYLIADRVFTKN